MQENEVNVMQKQNDKNTKNEYKSTNDRGKLRKNKEKVWQMKEQWNQRI